MKKLDAFINLMMVFGLGVFTESIFAGYRDYVNHPEDYEIMSAPWYDYKILPNAVLFVAFIILCLLVKLAIHKRIGRVILGVLALIAGILSIVVTVYTRKSRSYSIIGGADGPTAIFLAGKVDIASLLTGIVLGIILTIVGIVLITKKKASIAK